MSVKHLEIMQRSDFFYDLPDELIAQQPLAQRTASRLLCVDGNTGALADRQFTDIVDQLHAGDLLVLNDTRVINARLFGQKATGGKVEVLVERVLDAHRVLAHIRASKSPKPGSELHLEPGLRVHVMSRQGDNGELFELQFEHPQSVLELLDQHGHVPLPPYIQREDVDDDLQRYQTVFAKKSGAVAAPTAGLHFDDAVLAKLAAKGVKTTFVTLHVGAGTFQPVRADNLDDHVMHSEWLQVDQTVCDAVAQTRAAGGRVIAVGTTAVRSLESAAQTGQLKPFTGDTRLFIRPGYSFQVVDALITNFHLPESTLLMLVSAFSGYEHMMAAYQYAVAQRYRFFSYGDAMFLTRANHAI